VVFWSGLMRYTFDMASQNTGLPETLEIAEGLISMLTSEKRMTKQGRIWRKPILAKQPKKELASGT
jgi:hypothetical protein